MASNDSSAPFDDSTLSQNWDTLDHAKFADETTAVRELLGRVPLSAEERIGVVDEAVALVESARKDYRLEGVVESFLQEFSLGTREGLARGKDRLGRLGQPHGPVREPVRQRLHLGADADRQAGRGR